ncbi:MAG TPA: TonB-dependent receptor [Bacteroidales bacterium]|nr:TonB-dependent receptor [Bacteroidales bacterium]
MQITKYLRRIALFFLSMVLSLGVLSAQEKTITGKVSATGEGPLPGVNVTVQGTVIGAITDLDGAYKITVPGPGAVLEFSFIGYTNKQVPVGTQSVIDVVLESDVTALQEVVVTGYSSQRRRDLTGSVGVVETAKLTAVPTGNVSNSLQGRTSGVTVVGDGRPGETSKVRIRGLSSFENNDPLYVVDGVPTQDISSINPNDIQSLSVLKDAGAASIYGSRASNGVIIVTTKKGSSGTKVTYGMYVGTQSPGNGPTNLLNTQEEADLQWLVYKNDGTVDNNPLYGPSTNASPTLPYWAGNTNWYKELTRNAMVQNHDLTISGGNDNAKFFAALGALSQDGIVIYTDAKKYTARFNSEFTFLNDRVKFGENLTMAYRTKHGVSNQDESSPIVRVYSLPSIIPVHMTVAVPDGLSGPFEVGDWGGTGIASRLGAVKNVIADQWRSKDNDNWEMRIVGSAFIDVKIMQGLNFRSTLGGTFNNGYYNYYGFVTHEAAENTATNNFTEGAWYGNDWVSTNTFTLDKTFGQHKILAVAGYEAVKYGVGRDSEGRRADYFSDDVTYRTLNNGASTIYANSSLNTPTTLVSQFLRADYALMDKYLLSATVRRDGSSRFGPDTRYGVFPSFSAGWRLSDESFLQGVSFINDLKLRGSWGTMGNQLAVSPQNQFYAYGGSPGDSFYDINGTGNSSVQGFSATRIGNPNAKWETNVTSNIGFEATILNNKVGIKFDWYQKKTKDLLYNPELPGTAGDATPSYLNIAAMSNTGLDMEFTLKDKFGDLGFDASVVLTTYKNNIDKIAEGVTFFDPGNQTNTANRINGVPSRNMVGHPMSAFFGYKVDRLFQEADFHTEVIDGISTLVQNSDVPTQDGAAPGFFKFQDSDNDGVIYPEDRVFIGNPNPKFTYGFNLAFTYKNFDLSAFLYGSQGNDIFNWNKWQISFAQGFGQKGKDLLYNSWTLTNTGATVPKASSIASFSTLTEISDFLLEDGSFLRMKNLQLGYTIPENLLSKVSIQSLRVYVQAVNLFTITKYSGLDPEIGGWDTSFGIDAGNYPLVKQFLFGLNVSF